VKKVIILGSSRKNGDTKKVVAELMQLSDCDLIELSDFKIAHFDYEHLNKEDDFLTLIKRIVNDYEVLIFATPVYWYAMSGIMKVFFDRLTDLLQIEKSTGRKLRTKYMAVISCSNGDNLEDDFWLPFKKSAAYLGMKYITDLHTFQDTPAPEKLVEFMQRIETSIQ